MSILVLAVLFLQSSLALPLNSPLLPSYDYIVIGGGPAGLTVANRLSEDPTVTVLLLEAGPAPVAEPMLETPGYLGHSIGSKYDWNLSTVPQTYLDSQPRSIPQGRGLGGGTLINGMLWSRGGQDDFDDWVELGNPGWGWVDMLPYFMKSERYTPLANDSLGNEYSILTDPGVHGNTGPVNVSFPHNFWHTSINLFDALSELGIPTAYDPNVGNIAGASFLPLDLDPENQTRSDAMAAYYTPYANRLNL